MKSNTCPRVCLSLILTLALTAMIAPMTGCGSAKKKDGEQIDLVGAKPATTTGEDGQYAEGDRPVPEPIRQKAVVLKEMKVIHFDYDSAQLRDDVIPLLNHNAEWLLNNPEMNIQVEGHCDERGSREYNINLGDRRAKSVCDYLIKKGVAPDRLHPISYGEDRPVAFCHNESCWWQNRRVEFKGFVD